MQLFQVLTSVQFADDNSRLAGGDDSCGKRSCNNAAGTNYGLAPDLDTLEYNYVHSQPDIVANDDWRTFGGPACEAVAPIKSVPVSIGNRDIRSAHHPVTNRDPGGTAYNRAAKSTVPSNLHHGGV